MSARAQLVISAALLVALVSSCHSEDRSGARSKIAAPSGQSIGLVLVSYDYMMRPDNEPKARCPDGPVTTNEVNWKAQFPSKAAQRKHLAKCWSLKNRGPNCENVWSNPDVVTDPLPYHEVRGKHAYGTNLDGTLDGSATQKTCAHEKFQGTDGAPGIDNQYYRWAGCQDKIFDAAPETTNRLWVQHYLIYRLLVEIRPAQDTTVNGAVDVLVYRGNDPLLVDADGKAVAWQSQHITNAPIYRLRGRLLNNILTTEPADVVWEEADNMIYEKRLFIRDMTLRLELKPTSAVGLRAGYLDLDQLWATYSSWMDDGGESVGASAPAAYSALHRLADGYKDGTSGACTALSSARKLEFVRAYLIHSAEDANQ